MKNVEEKITDWYGNENEFRDKLGNWLYDKGVRQHGQNTNENEWAKITNVKIDKRHPSRNGKPDIHIYHTGFELGWRDLSNPFFIECKDGRGFQDDFLQFLRYKYDDGKESGLKKIGQYHVAYTSPKTIFKQNPFKDSNYYSYPQFERTLWHLGLGLLRKGYHNEELLLTFNEREQAVIR